MAKDLQYWKNEQRNTQAAIAQCQEQLDALNAVYLQLEQVKTAVISIKEELDSKYSSYYVYTEGIEQTDWAGSNREAYEEERIDMYTQSVSLLDSDISMDIYELENRQGVLASEYESVESQKKSYEKYLRRCSRNINRRED